MSILNLITENDAQGLRAALPAEQNLDYLYGGSGGQSALMLASKLGHTECMSALIEAGASISLNCGMGWTALLNASFQAKPDAVALLLRSGASAKDGHDVDRNPLIYAMNDAPSPQRTACVKILLDNGANPNVLDNETRTPLFRACGFGLLDVARLLILYGADVNIQSQPTGQAPLHKACTLGKRDMVELFVSQGAQNDLRNAKGLTPFEVAAYAGQLALLPLLLELDFAHPGLSEMANICEAKGLDDCALFLRAQEAKLQAQLVCSEIQSNPRHL